MTSTVYNSILGTDTVDNISGTSGADSISALQASDFVNGLGGADLLFGGKGNDELVQSATANETQIRGDEGNDVITLGVTASGATLYGGKGNDVITFGKTFTNAYASGDKGADTLDFKVVVNSTLNGDGGVSAGDEGNDEITFTTISNGVVLADIGDDIVQFNGKAISSTLYGGKGDDTITDDGSSLSKTLVRGDLGDDVINFANTAQFINSTILGDNGSSDGGDDSIVLTNTDSSSVFSSVSVEGGAGADTIEFYAGELLSSSFNANAGNDVFSVGGSLIGTTVYGGQGNDVVFLTGDTSANFGITGGVVSLDKGNDVVSGKAMSATLLGGDGVDVIGGSFSSAYLQGNAGNDFIGSFTANKVTIYGGQGADTVAASSDNGVTVEGIVMTSGKVYLDKGNDVFSGANYISSSKILGGDGNDTISLGVATQGGVSLVGGTGADSIKYNVVEGEASGTTGQNLGTYFFGFGGGNDTIDFTSTITNGNITFAIDETFNGTGTYVTLGGTSNAATLTLGTTTVTFTAGAASFGSTSASVGDLSITFTNVSASSITSLG
ncbi:serralysin-like metalloprotease/ C-terminal domain-containing protein [Synechococcus sp. PROS-7-1]|uniref:beta strand repeat-containing protein n=1 Tax=Synechococcus sp. PROS-7-1 TaxID=1442556 RepID=UPI0016473A55|nr:calcium-binding protein [Synechococcus sp. PROS-7-1]QNI83975.1 serralysin-like metalloprotease/ C-terminal domain-containing protein [Synechococcus sp. PROS-7-1]